MSNNTIKNEARVLGRVLSQEQTRQVGGGDTAPAVDNTDASVDTAPGGVTTIGRDSGVWGEGYRPHN